MTHFWIGFIVGIIAVVLFFVIIGWMAYISSTDETEDDMKRKHKRICEDYSERNKILNR